MTKEELRKVFAKKRGTLSLERREQASELAFTLITQWLRDFSADRDTFILSFAPFKDELDIWPINRWILKERHLLLPRLEKDDLHIYPVDSLHDLQPSQLGILEPPPSASRINPKQIDIALIAGLAFDNRMHRLGYGKGHYDRFLQQLHPATPKIGLGFKEQLSVEPLPVLKHDIVLTHRFLF